MVSTRSAALIALALVFAGRPGWANSDWTGQGLTANWTNPLNWFGGVPAKSATEQVSFCSGGGSQAVMNENWTLGGIEFSCRFSVVTSSGLRLILFEGIRYSAGGDAVTHYCYPSDLASIDVPISLGAGAGVESTNAKCTEVPFYVYGDVNNNGNPFALRPNGSPIEMYGVVSGAGHLVKQGSGDARLRSVSTYTGDTLIDAGVLRVRPPGRLPNSSDVRVNAPGRLSMEISTADAINGLYGTGSVGISGNDTLVIGNFGVGSLGEGDFSGSFDGDGKLEKRGASGTQILGGAIGIQGPITVAEGTLVLASGATVTRAPDLVVSANGMLELAASAVLGDLSLDGSAAVTGDATFAQVDVGATGLLGLSGVGAVRATSVTLDAAAVLDMMGGTLETSSFVGALTADAGTVSPGPSVAELQISGPNAGYEQLGGAELLVEIGGVAPGSDRVRVADGGTALLAGALRVELVGGFVPVLGEEYVIVRANTVVGEFATLELPALPDVAFEVSYLPDHFDDPGVGYTEDVVVLRAVEPTTQAVPALGPGPLLGLALVLATLGWRQLRDSAEHP